MRLLRRLFLNILCWMTIVVVRILLWITKHQRIRAWLVRPCAPDPQPERRGAVGNVVRAIRRTARLMPGATCLTQSIACQAVLSWRGIPSVIEVGVMKDKDTGDLRAHAWLVWNGRVVLEGDDDTPETFTKMTSLPTPTLPARP